MGVRGLTSLLSRHGRPEPVDLAAGHAGRTVVLDVPSFAIWLFLAFFRQASMLANTDYARVDRLVRNFVRLFQSFGIALVGCVDGAKGSDGQPFARIDEYAKRSRDREVRHSAYLRVLRGRLSVPQFLKEHQMFPLPPLFTAQVAASLREAGVALVGGEGEADLWARKLLGDPNVLAVLSSDSDFAMMQHGRWMPLAKLQSDSFPACLDAAEPPALPSLPATVWTAQGVADLLQVPLADLPAVAFLMGNDDTHVFMEAATGRGFRIGKHVKVPVPAPVDVLAALRPHVTAEQLEEAAALLQRVREFYVPAAPAAAGAPLECDPAPVQPRAPSFVEGIRKGAVNFLPIVLDDPAVSPFLLDVLRPPYQRLYPLLAPDATVTEVWWQRGQLHRVPAPLLPAELPLEDLARLSAPVRWTALLSLFALPDFCPTAANPGAPELLIGLALRRLHGFLPTRQAELDALIVTVNPEWWTAAASVGPEPDRPVGEGRRTIVAAHFQLLARQVLDVAALLHFPGPAPANLFSGPAFRCLALALEQQPAVGRVTAADVCGGLDAFLAWQRRLGLIGEGDGPLEALLPPVLEEEEEYVGEPELNDEDDVVIPIPFPPTSPRDGPHIEPEEEEEPELSVPLVLRLAAMTPDAVLPPAGVALLTPAVHTAVPSAASEAPLRYPVRVERRDPAPAPAPDLTPLPSAPPPPPPLPPAPAASGPADLPIATQWDDVVAAVQRHPVTLIVGPPGCGKSTRVPRYLLRAGGPCVVVSQPYAVAARQLAARVAEECAEELGEGERVAYLGPGEEDAAVLGRLTFMTHDLLLHLLLQNPSQAARISHVVLDEVHERPAGLDLLLLWLKLRLPHTAASQRLVLMSATPQAELLLGYLPLAGSLPHVVTVAGHSHPLQTVYIDELDAAFPRADPPLSTLVPPTSAWATDASARLMDLASILQRLAVAVVRACAKPGGTVVVFVPGRLEVAQLLGRFQTLPSALPTAEGLVALRLLPFHADQPPDQQAAALAPPLGSHCHVVLATEGGDTALTFPNVVATIDFGLQRQLVSMTHLQSSFQMTSWVSKGQAQQRSGRAGRTCPGLSVRLWPRRFQSWLPEVDKPQLPSLPLPTVYLHLHRLAARLPTHGLHPTVPELWGQLPQPPTVPEAVPLAGVQAELEATNALTEAEAGAAVTPFGRLLLAVPLSPHVARLLWLGARWGWLADAVVLAASFMVPDPFLLSSPRTAAEAAERRPQLARCTLQRWTFDAGAVSEPLMYRSLFIEWWATRVSSHGASGPAGVVLTRFCARYSVHASRLLAFEALVHQLSTQLQPLYGGDPRLGRQLMGLQAGPGAVEQPIFAADVRTLRCLLAASLGHRPLLGRPSRAAAGRARGMAAQYGLDPRRTVWAPVMNSPPEWSEACVDAVRAALGHFGIVPLARVVPGDGGVFAELERWAPTWTQTRTQFPPTDPLCTAADLQAVVALQLSRQLNPQAFMQWPGPAPPRHKQRQLLPLTHPGHVRWRHFDGRGWQRAYTDWHNPPGQLCVAEAPAEAEAEPTFLGCAGTVLERNLAGVTAVPTAAAHCLLLASPLPPWTLHVPRSGPLDVHALSLGGVRVAVHIPEGTLRALADLRAALEAAQRGTAPWAGANPREIRALSRRGAGPPGGPPPGPAVAVPAAEVFAALRAGADLDACRAGWPDDAPNEVAPEDEPQQEEDLEAAELDVPPDTANADCEAVDPPAADYDWGSVPAPLHAVVRATLDVVAAAAPCTIAQLNAELRRRLPLAEDVEYGVSTRGVTAEFFVVFRTLFDVLVKPTAMGIVLSPLGAALHRQSSPARPPAAAGDGGADSATALRCRCRCPCHRPDPPAPHRRLGPGTHGPPPNAAFGTLQTTNSCTVGCVVS